MRCRKPIDRFTDLGRVHDGYHHDHILQREGHFHALWEKSRGMWYVGNHPEPYVGQVQHTKSFAVYSAENTSNGMFPTTKFTDDRFAATLRHTLMQEPIRVTAETTVTSSSPTPTPSVPSVRSTSETPSNSSTPPNGVPSNSPDTLST